MSRLLLFLLPLQLLAFEADLRPLLYNKVEVRQFSHKTPHRLHSNSKIDHVKTNDDRFGQRHELVGRFKASNFNYSLTYTKNYKGNIQEIVEQTSDGSTFRGRPKYKSQYYSFTPNGHMRSHTECVGNLDKGNNPSIPARLRGESSGQIYLDYRCRSLSPRTCADFSQMKKTAKRMSGDPNYLEKRVQEDLAKDPNYQAEHQAGMAKIKFATPPGGRYNLVWPKDELNHSYNGLSANEEVNADDLAWLSNSCEGLATYLTEEQTTIAAQKAHAQNLQELYDAKKGAVSAERGYNNLFEPKIDENRGNNFSR